MSPNMFRFVGFAVLISSLLGCGSNANSGKADGKKGTTAAGKPGKTQQGTSANDDGSSSSRNYPRMVTKRLNEKGKEETSSGGSIVATDRGLELLADKFKQVDWGTAASKPSFGIELTEDTSLTVQRSGESTEESQLMVVWTRPGPKVGGATTAIVRRSQPLRDAAQALELLRVFLKKKGDVGSLVSWNTEKP